MAERILKFGGIDAISRIEADRGESEPDNDPRGQRGTKIVRGMHLMSAVDQLEPAAATQMAYFDPDAPDMDLDELEEAVQRGDLSLEEVMTKTSRFTPLVNPRRSRLKERGELSHDSDGDLWHVPTNNYIARTPRGRFEPLARAIDNNDSLSNDGVFGEFRERRNGGEVFGHVWFDDFDVGAIEGDPVRLGFKFGWNYFGDRAFFYQPFAQRTRCKNSVAPLGDKVPVMAHNKQIDHREMWEEAIKDLGVYGDELSQQIQQAREILYDFDGSSFDEEDAPDGVIPMPVGLEAFYEHAGLPDPRIPADHAREEARNSDDPRESANRISAWHVHNGATYWLSWHWNGSEDANAFRQYRRTANDMLFNPYQISERVRDDYEDEERTRIVRDVVGEGSTIEDATPEERAEIEERLADHEGIAEINSSVETLGSMVDSFEETEERLDMMQEAVAEQ